MKSIILAAGYATRLYPLTENFPKPLLQIGSNTILGRLLDDIDTIPEVDEHIIVTNGKFAPMFEAWAEERKNANLTGEGVLPSPSLRDPSHSCGAGPSLSSEGGDGSGAIPSRKHSISELFPEPATPATTPKMPSGISTDTSFRL